MSSVHRTGISNERRFLAFVLAAGALLGNPGGISAQPAKASAGQRPEIHLGRGYDALKNDRYDAAVTEFRAALQIDPKLTLRARFPLAVALFELHKATDARRQFEIVRREA